MGRRKRESGELTAQEQRFVEEYLLDKKGNATEAARRAGYAETTAQKKAPLWVNRVSAYRVGKSRVYEAINKARMERFEKVQIDAAYLLANAGEVLERCMQRAPVFNAYGKQVKDDNANNLWRFDAAGANKAIENIAKLLGLYKDKEPAGNTNIILTDEKSIAYQAALEVARQIAKSSRGEENDTPAPDDGA